MIKESFHYYTMTMFLGYNIKHFGGIKVDWNTQHQYNKTLQGEVQCSNYTLKLNIIPTVRPR